MITKGQTSRINKHVRDPGKAAELKKLVSSAQLLAMMSSPTIRGMLLPLLSRAAANLKRMVLADTGGTMHYAAVTLSAIHQLASEELPGMLWATRTSCAGEEKWLGKMELLARMIDRTILDIED